MGIYFFNFFWHHLCLDQMENVFQNGKDHLNDDQADDGKLEARGVLVIEFA